MKYHNKIKYAISTLLLIWSFIYVDNIAIANDKNDLIIKAKNHDMVAQYLLANILISDDRIQCDDNSVLYWYEKSAQQGYANAQFALAIIYLNNNNMKQSIMWLQKAAEQNHVQAQYYLGDLYRLGVGVESNILQALYWFKKSAEQDYIIAQIAVGNIYFYGVGLDIDKDYNEAIYWYKKAAHSGNAFAQLNLGIIEMAQLNYKKSLLWLNQACKNNLTDGCKLAVAITQKESSPIK